MLAADSLSNRDAPMTQTQTPARDGTARALIEAGMRLFGTKGFVATSTRELAEAAGANVAAISYHFQGKEGLRRACALEFVHRMEEVMRPLGPPEALSPEAAEAELKALMEAMISRILTQPDAASMIGFVMREVTEGGETLDILYDRLIAVAHGRLLGLWARASGTSEDDPESALRVFAMIGQVLYFRLGAEVVRRKMGWSEIGAAEAAQISRVVAGNLDAMLAQARAGTAPGA
ncbi:TetR family transcriptional regulator [Thioclava sp. ES.031]|nr:TetR family transcriptional regulator [Thioclava sp. ES.031]